MLFITLKGHRDRAMASNLLMTGLPAAERSRLRPFLEPVQLSDGQTLVQPGTPIEAVWFSEDAVLFTSQPLPNGARIPAGLAAGDGVAGFELWLGRNISPLSTVVEVGGGALRIGAGDLQREVLGRRSALNAALGDFVLDFITMGAQMATCLQTHSPEERLCRWLQMIAMRIPEREQFQVSENLIASLLGQERHTARLALRALEHAGLVEYTDQQIRILDKEGLLDGCCECLSKFQARLTRLQSAMGNA
jgi:CRP-like cAMP-binding protein